jgi:hypothetical protein
MDVGSVRFKKMDQIPYELIGELAAKVTVEACIKQVMELLASRKK